MKPLDPLFRDEVLRKITTFDREEILAAVAMVDGLPEPTGAIADDAAQLIHDVALHAESLSDWALCARLYLRVTKYNTADPRIPIGAWYRHALCSERIGDLIGAMASYRTVLKSPTIWPHVTALARFRLAELLMAAEEFEQALTLLSGLDPQAALPEIHPHRILINQARCLSRTGDRQKARAILKQFALDAGSSEFALDGLRLLAEICEADRDYVAARSCYLHILESPFAGTLSKIAATHRLEWIDRNPLR